MRGILASGRSGPQRVYSARSPQLRDNVSAKCVRRWPALPVVTRMMLGRFVNLHSDTAMKRVARQSGEVIPIQNINRYHLDRPAPGRGLGDLPAAKNALLQCEQELAVLPCPRRAWLTARALIASVRAIPLAVRRCY
jgi:hypothetical protein